MAARPSEASADRDLSPPPPASGPLARARTVGKALGQALRALLDQVPGAPHRPGRLAATLGVNRATASKLLAAAARRDPLEVLHHAPGPEPLRKLAQAAGGQGADSAVTADVMAAAEEFDHLIRDEAGTRPALDALISAELPGARESFELASKYSVFKGLSQLKGVQADLWFGLAVVSPGADSGGRLDLTWLNAAVAMRRLRPGVDVRFSYRHMRDGRTGGDVAEQVEDLPGGGVLSLDEFCANPPARLESRRVGDTIHYRLPDDVLGPKRAVDMFVVDHHPAAMSPSAVHADRTRNSLFVEPAIPSATLVFDVLLHDEVFPGSDPSLFVYDTSYVGLADVNDRQRDGDRIELAERVEFLGSDMARFSATELPAYGAIVAHLADRFGWDPARYRGYRIRIQYPVHGWQVCLSFERPVG